MLTAQLGDLVSRARRALKLTGRVPFALDEAIIPTAQLLDLGQDPFAQYPRRWSFPFTAAGNGVNQGICCVRNPAASGALVVVDGIHAANTVANYRLLTVSVSRNANAAALATVAQPQLTNFPSGLTATLARGITQFAVGTLAAPPGSQIISAYTASWSNPIWPPDGRLQVVLFPGDDLYIASPVAAVDAQVGFVYGREFPDTAA